MASNEIAISIAASCSGTLNYEDISDIVEALVYTEGRRYPIPGMDHEDIAQEIRMECLRILPMYDCNRIGPSPYKYFQVCIKNFLYNIKRGIWVPNNPPCVRCPFWDKLNKTCVIDEIGCDKIVQYRKNMSTKAALKQPASVNDSVIDQQGINIDAILLETSIRDSLPERLVEPYEALINGDKISSKLRKEIREITLTVIKEDA